MELADNIKKPGIKPSWTSIIRGHAAFTYLWISSACTGLAFSMYLLVEAWYVVQHLELERWLGWVMMATTLPRVLLMLLGGVVADRIPRSRILSFLGFSRGFLILTMAVLMHFELLPFGILIAFALSFGTLDAFFWPASTSWIPLLVKKEQLVRANAILHTTQQLSFFIGPALAGLMIKLFSFTATLSFVASVLFLSGAVVALMKASAAQKTADKKRVWTDLREGARYVRGVPYLLVAMGTSVIINLFLMGPINAGLPIFVKETLHGDVLTLSLLDTAVAGGMIIGGIAAGTLDFRRKRPVISLLLLGTLGIINALLSQSAYLWQGLVLLTLAGVCLSISYVISPAVYQPMIEPSMMGRVQSFMTTASMGLQPVSYALVSVLLSFGVSATSLIFYASFAQIAFVALVLWKVRLVWRID